MKFLKLQDLIILKSVVLTSITNLLENIKEDKIQLIMYFMKKDFIYYNNLMRQKEKNHGSIGT